MNARAGRLVMVSQARTHLRHGISGRRAALRRIALPRLRAMLAGAAVALIAAVAHAAAHQAPYGERHEQPDKQKGRNRRWRQDYFLHLSPHFAYFWDLVAEKGV